MFQVRLNPQGHGWLDAQIRVGDVMRDFVASDLGPNLAQQMTAAGLRLSSDLERRFAATIEFYGEPSGLTIYVVREGSTTDLILYEAEDVDSLPKSQYGDRVVKVSGAPMQLLWSSTEASSPCLNGTGLRLLRRIGRSSHSGPFFSFTEP